MERRKARINKKWTLGELRDLRTFATASSAGIALFRTDEHEQLPTCIHKVTVLKAETVATKPNIRIRNYDWANSEELQSLDAVEIAMETAISTEKNNAYLKGFINKIFNLSSDDCLDIWEKVQKRVNEPDLLLSCVVVKADVSAESRGTQDWYCSLGILHVQHIKNPLVQNRNLADWKKEGLISEVFTTSQQPDCRWDDRFELQLLKPADEYLVIEVWNQEKLHGRHPGDGKGLRKLENLLGQQEGSFVGRIFYSLESLSSQNTTKNMDLYSHSAKHKRGNLEILLSIKGVDTEKGSILVRLKEHRALVTKIAVHESKEDARRREGEDNIPPWDARMDAGAEGLIKLHAKFRSLSDFNQAAVRFSVLFSYHKANTLQLPVLTSLVDSISKLPLDPHPGDGAERTVFFNELQELLTLTLSVLNNHLVGFEFKSTSSVESLKEHLLLVNTLYSMEEFVNSLPSHLKTITGVVESAIQNSVVSWYSAYSMSLSVMNLMKIQKRP